MKFDKTEFLGFNNKLCCRLDQGLRQDWDLTLVSKVAFWKMKKIAK